MGIRFAEISINTSQTTQLIDITSLVQAQISKSGVQQGICCLFVSHTTAAITINENADPSVSADILMELNKLIPLQDNYCHREGNSAAHIKASLVGCSDNVFVEDGRLVLGTWQGIYFCEFDGPRRRRVLLRVIAC